jgi:hypothetical protein
VTVSGGSGNFTYSWSPVIYLDDPAIQNPVAIPDTSIYYTVTVDDGTFAVTSAQIHITVLPVPETPVITLVGDTLISDAQTGNQWYRYEEMIPGATGQKYVPVVSGDYSVIVSDTITGCSSLPSNIIPYYLTGTDRHHVSRNVSVYPNPSRDMVNISYYLQGDGAVMISLFDAVGKLVQIVKNDTKQTAGQHYVMMDGTNLDKGIYYLKVQTTNYSESLKLIMTK